MASTRHRSEMKVLVAEDFAVMRKIAVDMLKELQFGQISEAEDGGKALDILNEEVHDLVLTDWNMPNMSGMELLKAIRQDDKLKGIKVLLVTSEAKKDQVIEAAKAGVNGYIVKPFTIDELSRKINKVL